MKFLFSFIISICFTAAAFASAADRIKINIAGKNSAIELKYTLAAKKNAAVVITVSDANGKTVLVKNAGLVHGENTLSILEASVLAEGVYSVKMVSRKKILHTQFVIWK